ncbi:MAG: formate dehydrogenase [Dehalococcoidia bacterium]|nr:formate dehydrogenase [Dehalococcoidia bacterium]
MRPGHRHRFARLDRGVAGALAACVRGECDEPQAGSGEHGLTARLGRNDGTLADVLAQGGYAAYALAATLPPARIIEVLRATGLSGRGGAHFPVATKWGLVAAHEAALAAPKILVVNAEEGEPGVFKDRHLLEGDPHRLIEGILIACRAAGVREVVVYINGQARHARTAFERALADARDAGIVDGSALGGESVAIEVRSGAGGYVCGEESVILNSIEGERPVPRYKPPFATDFGLSGRPTLINNVETLCAVTTIFDTPPPPTKLLPLSGDVPRPGLYEVPVDGAMTWAGVLAMAGASPARVQALLLGGPSGRFVLPEEFDRPLEMRALGAGGTVVLGASADIARITRDLAAYNARESCGECTPCREGTQRLVQLLDDPLANRDRIAALIEVMTEASLCALGGMAGRPVTSALASFPQAFEMPEGSAR